MLPLTTIFYLALFFTAIIGSVFYNPLIGILGYLVTYNINPPTYWWWSDIPAWALRYAYFFAAATALGTIIHKSKLRFNRMFESQEILLILFIGLVWLSVPLGVDTKSYYVERGISIGIGTEYLYYAKKMTKIGFILLLASHSITTLRKYEIMVFVLIITGLFQGIETYTAPVWSFRDARLDSGVGGSDFSNGNMLSAHFIMLLPIIGIMFLKGGWKTKLLCAISAVFILNGLVLIRSRAAFLGLGAGAISAMVFSNKVGRNKIIILMLAGFIGGAALTNTSFWERMKLISTDTAEMDTSARNRVDLWKAAIDMALDRPLGVGQANFHKLVGRYNPSVKGKDTHNTYLKGLAELGFQGFFVLLLLIGNAFRMLSSISKAVDPLKNKAIFLWHIYALRVGLIAYLIVISFVSATYKEDFYWVLMFPVFLKRSVENEIDYPVLNNNLSQ